MQISDGFSGLLEALAGVGVMEIGMTLAMAREAKC